MSEKEKDIMLGLCIKQGYVPKKCKLPGVMAMGLVNQGEDPCKGCNLDRVDCDGRPKQPDYMDNQP